MPTPWELLLLVDEDVVLMAVAVACLETWVLAIVRSLKNFLHTRACARAHTHANKKFSKNTLDMNFFIANWGTGLYIYIYIYIYIYRKYSIC